MNARALRSTLLLSMALAACGGKPASSTSPGERAALGPHGSAHERAPKSGPVEVVYAAPRGESDGQVEVSVSFDRAMVALGADADRAQGVLQIEPAVEGRARWVGSQTLVFEPRAALPMATDFRVRVAQETRALDGNTLAQPFEFTFATPAPALVRSEPADGARGVDRKQWIELYFNQRVPLERVAEAVKLSVAAPGGASKPHPCAFERPDPSDEKRVRIAPKRAYPLGASVALALPAGLIGAEGARPLARDFSMRFEVYGALRVVEPPACRGDDCDALVTFTNPVHVGRAAALISFDPPLARPLATTADYESTTLYLGGALEPGAVYTVRVDAALRDVYGNALEGQREFTLRAPPLPPALRLALNGELLPVGSATSVRASLQNVREGRIELTPLRPEEVSPLAIEAIAPRARPLVQQLGAAGPSERKQAQIELAPLLQNGRGLLLASLHGQGREPLVRKQLIAYTDLAPTLKVSSRSGLVYVSRLSDAQPVAGAGVRVMRAIETVAAGQTDGAGVFRFTLPATSDEQAHDELAAVVDKDGDLSFARKYEGVGPWQLTENASSLASGPEVAHLFTERGIYRPGDTLQLKGILRSESERGFVPSKGDALVIALDANGRELERAPVALSEFGTFARALRIPGSAPLGPIELRVEHGGQTHTTSAEVAEYQPAELEASMRSTRERYVRGQRATARLSARFLFGAPAREADVYWTARSAPRDFASERHPGFTFHDERSWDASEEAGFALGGQTKLDAEGEGSFEVALESAPANGPSWLELEATVTASGAEIATRASAELTPADVVVGLRAASSVSESGKPFALDLIALTPSGEARAGVELAAKLLHRTFPTKLIDGRAVREPQDERVGSCRKASALEPVRCSFTPRAAGLHIAEVRARDQAGRTSVAALPVYIYGAGVAAWSDGDDVTIALRSARTAYALGETARVLVPSPFAEAEALITVERDGVLSVERAKVSSASTIDVRIDERFVPNAFVSVLLQRPRTARGSDSGLDYRIGAIELAADVSQRKLSVSVAPDAEDKRPGDEVRVALAVRDGQGAPVASELTVFAVDEGVLSLTGYRTPDPFAVLYAHRPLAVWTSDARANLARVGVEDDDEKGGDEGGGGGQLLRQNFAAVALFAPSVLTDAAGRAEVRFKLPDATTRYRVMAVAASRGAEVGAGEGLVRTHKPLLLRPLLPRVLRAGDTLQAGVSVHNESEAAMAVELTLETAGIELREAATKRVQIDAHQALEVRFATRAAAVGEARFTFHARAAGERDDVKVARNVLSPSPVETMAVAGSSEQASVREQLSPLTGLRADVGGLDVTLASTVLTQLEQPARALLAYEYGCSEQLASRLIALAALKQLERPLALRDPALSRTASELLSQLERHQREDGSFGLWRADDATPGPLSAFLTAYALVAFDELARAGIAPSAAVQTRARAYLGSYLRADVRPPALGDADRAFVLYALARAGAYDPGYGGLLYEQRGALPPFSRIELAHALTRDGARKAEVATLLAELAQYVRVTADEAHVESNAGDAYAPLLVSDVRASAQLVMLLLDHAPEHPLLPKLARWLAANRARDGSWGTTQASAWGLMALARYYERKERTAGTLTASAQLGDRVLVEGALTRERAQATAHVPMRALPSEGGALRIEKRGGSALHYVLRLSYARTDLPSAPSERGFFVERSYERIDPGALARGEPFDAPGLRAQVGDYVRVTLRVALPAARRFVLLSDPLPSGLVPIDLGLTTAAQTAGEALRERAPFDHRELRDDRVVFAVNELPAGLYRYSYLARAASAGTFVAPPSKVEEMYHPETHGLSAAATFEVAP